MSNGFEKIDDTNDIPDFTADIDETLNHMSLDELRDLRESLKDNQDVVEDSYEGTEELEDLGVKAEEADYSYHWDGRPMHNVEWDDNDENPAVRTKTLHREVHR